jgi:hypothetical protein
MADRPKPIVRLLLVATHASTESPDDDWVLRNPMAIVSPEVGVGFPWRERDIAVYAQLSGGMGRWELAVEFGQRLDNGIVRAIGTSACERDPGVRVARPTRGLAHEFPVPESAIHPRGAV